MDSKVIVQSTFGRDKDNLYMLIGYKDGRALLVNGKSRHLGKPKVKNLKHIKMCSELDYSCDIIKNGKMCNSYIITALTNYKRNIGEKKQSVETRCY